MSGDAARRAVAEILRATRLEEKQHALPDAPGAQVAPFRGSMRRLRWDVCLALFLLGLVAGGWLRSEHPGRVQFEEMLVTDVAS